MKTRFTLEQIQKLKADGKIKGYTAANKHEVNKPKQKLPKVEPKGLTYIKKVLLSHDIKFATEHVFAEGRRFRFDIAVLDSKVAIEYEGLFSGKSRHTTAQGYSKDTEKYNLAQSLGWRVFRYTAMTYKNFNIDLAVIKQTDKK